MHNVTIIKRHVLRFRAVNRDIFNAIKTGGKTIETRAATPKYANLKKGDRIVFVCGKSKFTKEIGNAYKFKSINILVKKYRPSAINPNCTTKKELEEMYFSFSNYKEKIKKFGIIALSLK